MNKGITITEEKNVDLDKIYTLIKTAFETAKVKDGDEQDFAQRLRESKKYIQELALVAMDNNEPIGHIMLTKLVLTDGNKNYDTLLLAPICIKLEYRNLGLGQKLMYESFKRAKRMGYDSVFLLGDPDYYGRVGFKSIDNFDIKSNDNLPVKYIQALELVENALKDKKGSITLI